MYTFYPDLIVKQSSKGKNAYIISVEKNIRDLLKLDEKIKELKKGQRLKVICSIGLLSETSDSK